MAVIGKHRYVVYLDPENVNVIREFLSKKSDSGGLSALLDMHVARCAALIKKNPEALLEIESGKMTVKKFVKLAKLNI